MRYLALAVSMACSGSQERTDGSPTDGACALEPCVGLVAVASFEREQTGAELGYAMASHEDLVVAGAPVPFGGDADPRGHLLDLASLDPLGSWEGPDPGGLTGGAVDVGDVDGDGVVEVVLGSPSYADGLEAGGRAHLVVGSVEGEEALEEVAALIVEALPSTERAREGYSDAVGGAVLLADLGAGARWAVAAPSRDEVWLFDPGLRGVVGRADAAEVVSGGAFFGTALAAWDGHCDGNPGLVGSDRAGVLWFEGPPVDGATEGPASTRWSDATVSDVSLGIRLRGEGDLDGDGCPDLVMGAPLNEGPLFRSGGVYVAPGGDPVGGDATSLPIQVVGDLEGEAVGYAVATGDLDGDGSDDLVVGAPSLHDGPAGGTVRLFLGPLSGVYAPGDADRLLHAERPGDFLGREMVIVDADGDAQDDLVVSASSAYGGGAVYLIPGVDWLTGG